MKKYIIFITIIILTTSALYFSFGIMREEKMENKEGVKRMENKEGVERMINEKIDGKNKEFETASGLKYEIIKMGDGEKPEATDKVTVHYHGTLVDGTVFDSSVDRGQTITFGLNQVIKGWTEGLQLMKEGSKWEFYIPSALAYGANGAGAMIGPNQALIFEVELIRINK